MSLAIGPAILDIGSRKRDSYIENNLKSFLLPNVSNVVFFHSYFSNYLHGFNI